MEASWKVGVDIGGTFTDVIAVHLDTGEQRVAKVRSRSEDPLSSLLDGLKAADLSWDLVVELIHGTTMVTNTIIEEKFNSVALISTEGFSDTIEIGRQNRIHLYRLDLLPKLKPLVPKQLRFEVKERLDHQGRSIIGLSRDSVKEVCEQIEKIEPGAVAVSLLHAYANPMHEIELGKQLKPFVSNIALSHEVNPEAREYERTSTTVLNASVMESVSNYLDRIDSSKPDTSELSFFHSAGGMITPDLVRKLPLSLAFSGPAAGVVAAGHVARALEQEHVISFDMGGTTTDVCLINNGQAEVSSNRSLNGLPLRMPMLALESIGAGGGSIARLDTGVLRVGPESAGASPGPACYGHGGNSPTVTDANLVLGYLSPEHRLGDGTKLDLAAAETVLQALAQEIGLSIQELALGILEVTNANMVRALRRITIDRGIDGRACTLTAFGGAGPIHAVTLARAFDIKKVVVPKYSSIFSAFGCITAKKSFTLQQTMRVRSNCWNIDKLNSERKKIVARLSATYQDIEADALMFQDVASIRYAGQSYSIEVSDPKLDDPETLGTRFKALHHTLYGFATDESWELESLRITASVPGPAIDLAMQSLPQENKKSKTQSSPCCFKGSQSVLTPRYDRMHLDPGQTIEGPAIIEDHWSTTVLPPGSQLQVDTNGNLIIDTCLSV